MRTRIVKVTESTYLLRLDDDETKYFEALWSISEGITYNSYLVDTGEHRILFDTWKNTYSGLFVETLKSIIDPRDIDYIVVSHMEPDHSGALPELLRLNDKITIYSHPLSSSMIESFYRVKPRFKQVGDGEELVSGAHKFIFIHTPWLHWPETIMTYHVDGKTLFSGDVFGAYSIPGGIYDDEVELEKYLYFAKKYFATVIGHYREWVLRNYEKIKALKPELIAPLHGVLWRQRPSRIIELYGKWARCEPVDGKVVVIYSSMYGFVRKAIDTALDEITRLGYRPVVFEFSDKYYSSISDLLGEAIDAEALVIGTATYEAEIFPYMRYIVEVLTQKISAPKPVLLLTVYGWGGVAGIKLREVFEKHGFRVIDVVEFRGLISGNVEERIREKVRETLGRSRS